MHTQNQAGAHDHSMDACTAQRMRCSKDWHSLAHAEVRFSGKPSVESSRLSSSGVNVGAEVPGILRAQAESFQNFKG